MARRRFIFTPVVCLALLGGCASYQSQQEQSGMLVGGLLGGLVGSQIGGGDGRTAAILLGTLIGSAVGGSVGRSMDETDRIKTSRAFETVRTGVPSSWRNPDTGHQYIVVPTRTFESTSGPCREYTIDALIGGRNERVFGTACRQQDGSWQIRN